MVDWSNLPLDIVEGIIGRLGSLDRISMRGVCKAWSVSNPRIPTIDNFPWALSGDRLIYPPLHKREVPLRREEFQMIRNARPHASSYGWLLFEVVEYKARDFGNFFLYSPFTSEVIKLPESDFLGVDVATLSLDATSPKCVIFGLRTTWKKICIYICSPGDIVWKTYEFDLDRVVLCKVRHVAYTGGILYCVFAGGEFGAFNLQLKEWTMLTLEMLLGFDFQYARLIASDGDLRLMGNRYSEDLRLLKFDFSEKRWVKEDSLNNRVLFIGGTCFSCPAVRETSQLANHVFSCLYPTPSVRCYGTESDSLQYQNWAWTAGRSRIWIEFPSTAIWSANDLVTAH
ncbi:hypothetical protein COLO4_15066 [Corchorus olitorius]|uniref:Uncharacterized protein n=1 Tax=Corchorus olitorius TaxID=93759 RepID=A0A1R3JPT4_9ROSI|nr:hypothetical protein COLO4_15066 [Corchorus olitorius]